MCDALCIEDTYKRPLRAMGGRPGGRSARAMCVLAWLIWRRDGRDVPLQDILDGKVDFDLGEMLQSMVERRRPRSGPPRRRRPPPVPTPAVGPGWHT